MKKIVITIITLAFIIGGYFAYNKFFKSKSESVTATVSEDVTKSNYDNEIPIFTDVPLDKVWEFTFDKELDANSINTSSIKVLKSDSKTEVAVTPSLAESGKKIVINPPTEFYEKGTTYELHLNKEIKYVDGSNVRSSYDAEFITARDEVEKAIMNKNLVYVEKDQVKSIEDNQIKLAKDLKKKLKKGDIIVVPTNEYPNGQAFKITEVDSNLTSITVTVTQPEFAELFEELDIYKTYEITAEHIQLEEGITGVSVEDVSVGVVNTMVAAANSQTQGENEFQIPKVGMDLTKGFKFSFENFQLGKDKKTSPFLNGSIYYKVPKISADVKMYYPLFKLPEIEKFHLIGTLNSENSFKLNLPSAAKNGGKDIVLDETKKKKMKKLTKMLRLATVNIPLPQAPVVTLQGAFYLKVNYNFSYQPEVSVTFEFEDIRGVVYDGKKLKSVKESSTKDVDFSLKGTGKLEGRLGGATSFGIAAMGVMGAGLEGFGGVKATGEFFNGNNNDVQNYLCYKASFSNVIEGNLFVDILNDRLAEVKFAEFTIPPELKWNKCEIFESLNVGTTELTMKPNEKKDFEVKGNYLDMSNQKTKTKKLENIENLKVTSSDESTVKVSNKNGKVTVEVPEYPSSESATITLEYTEKGELLGEDVTSKVEIAVKLVGVPKSLPETEVKKIVSGLVMNIKKSFNDLGQKYSWSNLGNPVDYNILGPELLNYATNRYTYDELKNLAEEYYCECDAYVFTSADFDIRMKIIENTNKKIVVSGIDFANEINGGGTVYFTVVNDKGKWLMDNIKYVSPEDEDMKVTWEEYHAYEKKYLQESGTLVNTVTDKGRKVYVVTYGDLAHKGIYAYSTDSIWEVPNEWLPENLRVSTTDSLQGKWRGGFGNLNITSATSSNFDFSINVVSQNGHVGDISGKATIDGNTAIFTETEYGCRLDFSLKGSSIGVSESFECTAWHGMSISFEGDYRKE